MRLLERDNTGEFHLTIPDDAAIPPYAILSHTWREDEEVLLKDLADGTGKNKAGYAKIRFCGDQAWRDGLKYFWVDTCCINKSDAAELQHAHNSMFQCIEERMSWVKTRTTTRKEDKVYSLFGIFEVCMPILYGEGEDKAFKRLREEISKDDRYLANLHSTDPRLDKKRIEEAKGGLLVNAYR
ncbi:hypothetical protein B0T26DRAFT_746600 [Lasiosphaeria miniovina]|uniref:Heterokaryon incompatibility domain-containing protein n=1 Tax=Lasiosphaeria miniovina TaxID=1954250 RepID=A0AA40BIB0_9PEZI|nr:uncharacterized protein B0T26DRAFT_746600 [Lasiosphaeria miniovina]KAK0734729.1 hypothetical protein B0T26DRAFT_746600 [Lasiosphaeria miniovina]